MMQAQASMVMVITFCRMMKTLLSRIFVMRANVPRTTSTGLAREMITAGMAPERSPMSTMPATNAKAVDGRSST